MKKIILLLIVTTIFLSPFNYACADSSEMTKEFKEVATVIAKEEFREFLFTRIQTQDLCLSISIYDLLGKLIYSDKYDDISRMIIESYVDYVSLLGVKSHIEELLYEKEEDGARFEKRSTKYENNDLAQDDKLTKKKINLLDTIKKDRFLSFSALYWYTISRKHEGLSVSPYLLDLLEKNRDEFDALIVYKKESDKNNEVWKTQIIKKLLSKKYDKWTDVRYSELIKYILIELLESREGWETRIKKAYNDFYNVVKRENIGKIPENPTTKTPILESIDVNDPITKITEIVGYDFKKMANKKEHSTKDISAKFLSVVSAYSLGIFKKPAESYRTLNKERFVNDVLELFESIESQRSKKGFGFAVGLWYGKFFSGDIWVNEDQSKLEYPVQSFRINDRLQYTFIANNNYSTFVYAGGIIDMLTSNMFNRENKKFFYFGIGIKPEILKNISLCYAATMPPTYSKNNVIGSVASIMYDIPFTKVWKILSKKDK